MLGLSFWQPYATLVAMGLKPIENRDWRPPPALYREDFAIHAAKVYDPDADGICDNVLGPNWKTRYDVGNLSATGIIGVARVKELADPCAFEPLNAALFDGREADRRWWWQHLGKWGWLLERQRRIATPIPCPGRQKLWNLDNAVAAELEVALHLLKGE